MLYTTAEFFVYTIWFVFKAIWSLIEEILYWHWHIRKTYQTSLYRFNAYHGFKLWKRKLLFLGHQIEFNRDKRVTYSQHFKFLKLLITIIEKRVTDIWYTSCWVGWCWLTYYLYYHPGVRDLGPSFDAFDYYSEMKLGVWWTLGSVLLICWALWTLVANSVFIVSIHLILNKFFLVRLTWQYWHFITVSVFFDIQVTDTIINTLDLPYTFYWHYYDLIETVRSYFSTQYNAYFIYFSSIIITPDTKSFFLWFPWHSFFHISTIVSVLYLLVLLNVYNTENSYYLILYTMVLILLFMNLLIALDVDLFGGLLVLIESVIVLMLFFLAIFLTPNINLSTKVVKWKVYMLLVIFLTIVSFVSYMNLGPFYYNPQSISIIFLEEYYGALNEDAVNDLSGIFVSLYRANSILLVCVGLLLLISSMLCVVLVSFFTQARVGNFKQFLEIFKIAKTVYSFIFLRKQNLSKQARNTTSTRIFNKTTFDEKTHTTYREKYEAFEKKKNDEKKKA